VVLESSVKPWLGLIEDSRTTDSGHFGPEIADQLT